MQKILSLAFLILFASSYALHADLYRWQDENGNWHVANDLEKIPEQYKEQAKEKALRETKEERPPSQPMAEEALTFPKTLQVSGVRTETESQAKTYSIEYLETDNRLELEVTFNGNHTFDFMLDTGASYVVLSKEAAEQMGYDPEEILPRLYVSTANGVITSRLVRLASVKVGDAEVHDVTALVQEEDNLGVKGLLGLSFLNEFDWSNDTMNGVLTLREFTNRPGDEVYGGHNRKWWGKKFGDAKKKIEVTEARLERIGELRFKVLRDKRLKEKEIRILEANRAFYKEELEILDRKANRYMVPRYWR